MKGAPETQAAQVLGWQSQNGPLKRTAVRSA
jgi:hypothetical protein